MRNKTSIRLRTLLIAGAGLSLLLSGCGSPSVQPSQPSVVGQWSSDEQGTPHLNFDEDGAVKGSDGCNSIQTTYTMDGNVVTLEEHISTLRACPGVDTWLRDAVTLQINGDEATVFNKSEEEIGTLHRTED